MTETTSTVDADDMAGDAYWAITWAAERQRYTLYTPSVLQAAAAALTDVLVALAPHDLTIDLMNQGFPLGERVLKARSRAYDIEVCDRDEPVDPIALLYTVISAMTDHLGRPIDPIEGPTTESSRAQIAYVVLPRLPASPAWGREENAPLVICLGRADIAASNAEASSAYHSPGDYGPWRWHLNHRPPHSYFIGGTDVIAQPLSSEAAAEVGRLAADVLTGKIELPR